VKWNCKAVRDEVIGHPREEVISMAEKPTTGATPQTPTTAKKPKREKGKNRTQR